MVVEMASKQSHSVVPAPLQPRAIKHEPTPAEIEAQRRESRRKDVHRSLHELYDEMKADEYRGPLNSHQGARGVVVEHGGRAVAVVGLELAPRFVSYLHRVISGEVELPQSTPLAKATLWLAREQKHLYSVLILHLEEDMRYQAIAERKHTNRKIIGREIRAAVDLIADWLEQNTSRTSRN